MKSKNFWENFILVAIILVIVQTFLDELSVYQHWSIIARNSLLYCALFFDLIFSIEFTVRSLVSGRKGNFLRYWVYERGWIDFLSSFPLLLLNSGPSVYLLLFGHLDEGASAIGVLNVLKVVKAIRVTRILRLVRIIKIFGKIQNAESPMAQRHTATISTTAVFTMICTLVIFSLVTTSPSTEKIRARHDHYQEAIKTIYDLNKISDVSYKSLAGEIFSKDGNLLKLNYKDKLMLSNITDDYFRDYYGIDDYVVIKKGHFTLKISMVDINKQIAYEHILNFFIIIFTVLAFMLVYTRHFAQTISDILHVMNKGFRKKNYNLQVKIREEFEDEEIFKLAKFYNDAYLPAKFKRIHEQDGEKSAGISMDFLTDFKKK